MVEKNRGRIGTRDADVVRRRSARTANIANNYFTVAKGADNGYALGCV